MTPPSLSAGIMAHFRLQSSAGLRGDAVDAVAVPLERGAAGASAAAASSCCVPVM